MTCALYVNFKTGEYISALKMCGNWADKTALWYMAGKGTFQVPEKYAWDAFQFVCFYPQGSSPVGFVETKIRPDVAKILSK